MNTVHIYNYDYEDYAFLFIEYSHINIFEYEDYTFTFITRIRFDTNLRKNSFLPAKTPILDILLPNEELESFRTTGIDLILDNACNKTYCKTIRTKFSFKNPHP